MGRCRRRLLTVVVTVLAVVAGPGVGIASAKPVNNVLPEVTHKGALKVGERIECASGSWTGIISKFEYKWLRGGVPVGSVFSYTLSAADEGQELWCVATAVEGSERVSAESINSVEFGAKKGPPEPPTNLTPPAITGKGEVGQTLTCSGGTWNGRPAPALSYRWLRDKEAIKEATSNTYKIAGEDEGHSLSCKVTATNEAGSATAESPPLGVPGKPPKASSVPKILGTAQVGQTLTCSSPEATWEGSKPLTFQFQWRQNGAAIPFATGSTLFVEAAFEGKQLSCAVTATNGLGSGEALSSSVTVPVAPPTNTQEPVVTGEANVGKTLSCSQGSWTGSPTEFKYEWLRGTQVVQAESAQKTYVVKEADREHSLFCTVTAKNSGGQASRESGPFFIPGVEPGLPPVAEGKPEIGGVLQTGKELSCSNGKWHNEPTEFVYQWIRDHGLPEEISLEAGTTSKYKIVSADEGHLLSCRVTAINKFGQATAESETVKMPGKKPAPTSPAAEIHGNGRAGETLTCLHGGWTGTPAPTFSYVWKRQGTAIGGAASYVVTGADRGFDLTCVVTGHNTEGEASEETASLYIVGSAPQPAGAPTISGAGGGLAEVGATLTCVPGEWSGAPAPQFAYEWLVNGVVLPEESKSTYGVPLADRGYTVSCGVTGSSREGTATVTSLPVRVAGLKPVEVIAPQVTGTPASGLQATCQHGVWKGAPPPTFTYQWFRDGAPLAGATESSYTMQPVDVGHVLTCNVLAANIEGQVEAESSNSLLIQAHAENGKLGFKFGELEQPNVSAAIILTALRREITQAQQGLRRAKVLKNGGFSFAFTAPMAGTLQVSWYQTLPKGHGKKATQLLVGRSSLAFTAAVKRTMHLSLTSKGRSALKANKRLKLTVKAVFTGSIKGKKPVTWTGTLLLQH